MTPPMDGVMIPEKQYLLARDAYFDACRLRDEARSELEEARAALCGRCYGSGSFVAALKAAQAAWPKQRLGQLIDNAIADHDRASLFHISNDDLLGALRQYAEAWQ